MSWEKYLLLALGLAIIVGSYLPTRKGKNHFDGHSWFDGDGSSDGG